ncbi:ExbD/TolR family protein [Marinobacter confluentis]|uniref:Biopolymer transporter ExbD n=1 Tax=Marinobacter confluentis TaxID=1697557 RepID=A0A4Z1C7G5_9GAMM|nr:biopolymer transporter ExbD [Marinobacter confluentis]TGN39345.1 biopolymer transporter ExbD [Marinobacter confluentis]
MKDFVPHSPGSGKSLMERVEDALLPLINLVFLLLMFFIVAGQMQDRALPPLPGTAAEQTSARSEADLVVQASGVWQVEGENVDAGSLVRHLPAPDSQSSLTVAAASGTAMSHLESLFNLLSDAGYEDIELLTEPGQ